MTLHDFIVTAPDEAFSLLHNGENITWRELRADIAKTANALQTIPEESVALFIEDSRDFLIAFLALLSLDKDIIVLPPALAQGPMLLEIKAITSAVITKLPVGDNAVFAFKPFNGATAISFYTSGSSGKPKLIRKTFDMFACEVTCHIKAQALFISRNPLVIASIPCYHVYSILWRVLFTLASKLQLYTGVISAFEELEVMTKSRESLLFISSPSFLGKIAHYGDSYNFKRSIIAIFSSGNLLETKVANAVHDILGVFPIDIYGSTETGGIATKSGMEAWQILPYVKIVAKDGGYQVYSDSAYQSPYMLSDRLEMLDDNTFLLHGRLDRVVKVRDKRVSLPEVEERLGGHPFVESAYVSQLANGLLGVLMTLTPAGKEFVVTRSKREAVVSITTHLSSFFEPIVLPKKFRIVYEIPKNPQGKILKQEIIHLFDSKIEEPIVLDLTSTQECLHMNLAFFADAVYFGGHFPDFPILPGVVQVYMAERFARLLLFKTGKVKAISKLKFANIIKPRQRVILKLCGDGFEYSDSDGKIYSSGVFEYV